MFYFPGCALRIKFGVIPFYGMGFPHSDIPGSKVARHLPEAYRSHATSFFAVSSQGIHHMPLCLVPMFWYLILFTPLFLHRCKKAGLVRFILTLSQIVKVLLYKWKTASWRRVFASQSKFDAKSPFRLLFVDILTGLTFVYPLYIQQKRCQVPQNTQKKIPLYSGIFLESASWRMSDKLHIVRYVRAKALQESGSGILSSKTEGQTDGQR